MKTDFDDLILRESQTDISFIIILLVTLFFGGMATYIPIRSFGAKRLSIAIGLLASGFFIIIITNEGRLNIDDATLLLPFIAFLNAWSLVRLVTWVVEGYRRK